jgi:hypothetical protein
MALRAKWLFMDWSVTHKIVYGPQLRFGPYNTFWVASRSINCHMALSAMNYLLNNTFSLSLLIAPGQYLQINTWAFPYWSGYHPETPYWPETQSRANMGQGMINRPIWKCPCIKLFITYTNHDTLYNQN